MCLDFVLTVLAADLPLRYLSAQLLIATEH